MNNLNKIVFMNLNQNLNNIKLWTTLKNNFFEICDDSDDDTNEEISIILKRYITEERTSVSQFFEEVVPRYSEQEFLRFFRLSRSLFNDLVCKYEASEGYRKIASQDLVLTAGKTMAIFLWFAAHETESYRRISNLFDVTISTVHAVIRRVIIFISCLAPDYVRWPTTEEMKYESEHNLKKSGIPGVIGAVDGTHIRIDPPTGHKDEYVDRKGDVTLLVQAVCNSKKKFTHITIGYPGSVHDARAYRCSKLPEDLERLPDEYLILGDSAYPITPKLLTPYRDNGHLTAAQKSFNQELSKCRVMIEHSFGILKQRFRQLYHCKLKGHNTLCHFIRSCIVLHNMCKLDELEVLGINSEVTDAYPQILHQGENEKRNLGKAKRDEICANLLRNQRNARKNKRDASV